MEPLFPEAGGGSVLLRGLRKRCPRCGERGLFRSWFHMRERCPRCELRFEREEGGYLGAMILNYSFAIALWIAMLGVVLAFTVPDVPVAPLLLASVVVLIVVPLWFYPRSKALWAAIEYLIARSQPGYQPPVRRDRRTRDLE